MPVTSAEDGAGWPAVEALLHSVYDQVDADAVHAQFDRVLDQLGANKLPAAVEHLEAARADVLAFTGFAEEIWRQTRSNNPQERLNEEIRRRAAPREREVPPVVEIFPHRTSLIRLVGAVLAEQHDEWTEGRRYLGLDVLGRSRSTVIGEETTTSEEVTTTTTTTPQALTA